VALVLVVARERSVFVCLLDVVEDLENPARLAFGLLLREPPEAQLRVGGSPLCHEAGKDARNRPAPGQKSRSGAVFQPRERLARRLLLGVLLGPPLTSPELFIVDDRRARKAAFVRRPLDGDLGVRHLEPAAGEELLQVRLVVDTRRERMLDLPRERRDDGVLDRREAVLKEQRAERGLDDGGQHIAVPREALELVLRGRGGCALDETPPKIEVPSHLGASGTRDDVGTDLCELPLAEVRVAGVERMRDRELEDAVTEELEPLVGGATLARPRRVCEDGLRQLRRERVDQLREVGIAGYWCEVT